MNENITVTFGGITVSLEDYLREMDVRHVANNINLAVHKFGIEGLYFLDSNHDVCVYGFGVRAMFFGGCFRRIVSQLTSEALDAVRIFSMAASFYEDCYNYQYQFGNWKTVTDETRAHFVVKNCDEDVDKELSFGELIDELDKRFAGNHIRHP